MAEKPSKTTEPETPATEETAAPVATSDPSVLNEDALTVYLWISKAVRKGQALSVGAESEADTLLRVFESQPDDATVSAIREMVKTARENVPDAETVKTGLDKAVSDYKSGILAWEAEDTPEGFVLPEMPESVMKRKSGNATGRGANVPRPRGLRCATAEYGLADLKAEKGYLTCATLAQKIGDGVETATLLDAWREVAGADSEKWEGGRTETVDVKGEKETHSVTFLYIKG